MINPLKLYLFAVCFFCANYLQSIETLPEGVLIQRNIKENHQGPKIALVSFISDVKDSHRSESYNAYSDTVKFGTRSKELYCQKHGYDFIVGSKKLYECDGQPAPNKERLSIHWMKVPMLAAFLSLYDWVVWTDADSIFLNPDITLESILDDSYDILFGTQDLSCSALSTGHIFAKNTEWCRSFFNEWWSLSEEVLEGKWDLENLNEMLKEKPLTYLRRIKRLPTKITDLSPDEYEPGDFMVHFYAYHGKELFQIFKVFEERYGYIINNLENELLEEKLSKDRYTDHVRVFKRIFAEMDVEGLLEFGLGDSTKFFLNNAKRVVSLEFITNALNPDRLNACLSRYEKDLNWHPVAFLSGCGKYTYYLGQHPNFTIVQASSTLYDANSSASCLCNRIAHPLNPSFADDITPCIQNILSHQKIDVAFVDSGLILRGELVQLLFDKVPVIAAHDFPKNLSGINPDQDIYGYSFIPSIPYYQEIFIGPPLCRQGIKIWIEDSPEYLDLINALKELAQIKNYTE